MSEFIINAGELLDTYKQLKPFISKEETRYLGGINIKPKGDRVFFAATDGHKLCVMHHDYDFCTSEGIERDFNVILPAQSVDVSIAMLKAVKKDFPVVVKINATKLTLETTDESATFKLIDGTYPDYEKVIPDKEIQYTVSLAKAQAREAVKAVATFKQKDAMSFNFYGDLSPVKICGNNKTVVVMPTRESYEDRVL